MDTVSEEKKTATLHTNRGDIVIDLSDMIGMDMAIVFGK